MIPAATRATRAAVTRLRRPRRLRRVPVVLQSAVADCAAACLAMILRHYRHHATVTECCRRCGIGRDGVSAKGLVEAARSYGLEARAYRAELGPARRLRVPLIASWHGHHFVVVDRWHRTGGATVVDPAVGRIRLSEDELTEGYRGIAIELQPGSGFAPARRRRGWFAGQLRIGLRTHRAMLGKIVALSAGLQVLALAGPLAVNIVLGDVLPRRSYHLAALVGVGLVTLLLVQAAIGTLRGLELVAVQRRLDGAIVPELFRHVLKLPLSFFDTHQSADLIERVGSTALIREMLAGQAVSTILDATFLLGYLALLLALDPITALIALGLGTAQIAVVLGTSGSIRQLTRRQLQAQARAQNYLFETLHAIGDVKATGAEDRLFTHWSHFFRTDLGLTAKRGALTAAVDAATATLRLLTTLLLLWVGAERVLAGSLSVAHMLALNALAMLFLTPVSSVVTTVQRLQVMLAHVERINDLALTEPAPTLTSLTPSARPRISGRLTCREVSYRYQASSPPVLDRVSFDVEAGQKVAIVGPTASGKSTLSRLLLGLYQPTNGEILFDGISFQLLDHHAVRRQVGVVTQDAKLFSGSIRDNIALAQPDLSLERIRAAARVACLDDEISAMPLGYDTVLVEGGGLSGGQRQRLCLARAVATSPSLLVLDEATSHLDSTTEQEVEQRIGALGCTRIVIAHRLSTIADADQIIVLTQGRIREQGTHHDLVASEGLYARLVLAQQHTAGPPVAVPQPLLEPA